MTMALFTTASRHFVKAVGAKSLHPVVDLNSAERFGPFCLVKERKSIWPWRKPKLTPTQVSLNDVLKQEIPNLNEYMDKKNLVDDYKESPKFKIDGDIGSKIAEELSLDVSTVDTFVAEVSFGNIMKDKVNWERLERKLSKESFNMNHQLFLEVKSKKRTGVCIVIESLQTSGEGTLSVDVDEKGSASAAVNVPCPSKVTVDVHTKGDVESNRHLNYNIPPNTILAYGCTRLAVNDDGNVRMQVQLDTVDAAVPVFIEKDIGAVAQTELKTFKEAKEYVAIADCFLNLLSQEAVHGLFEVFAVAEVAARDATVYSRKTNALKEEIGGDFKTWLRLLLSVGFECSSDEKEIRFPKNDAQDLLRCCTAVTESLMDFNDTQLGRLQDCRGADAQKILSVLDASITGKMMTGNAGLKETSKEALLLKCFGLELEDSEQGTVLNTGVAYSEEAVRNLYIAVYALFV